jgi:arginase
MMKLAIAGFPFDLHSSFMAGAAQAPSFIREALACDSANMWSETGTDLGVDGIFHDAGDLDSSEPDRAFEQIEHTISRLLEAGLPTISLGGDHSITFPIIKAFGRRFDRLSILHFDAHPDIYESFGNNPHSHASPFARIMELGLVERLVQVGIRTMTGHQRDQVKRFGVEVIEMKDWDDQLNLTFESPVYISLDMDALDPAFAPGVSHHEPGGLSTRQVISVIQRLKGRVVGADIVEYNPVRDLHNMTAMVCAKLLKEIAAKMLEKR